ncbi:MAG: response regulator transcription factor [Anaerolineae bacterium]|nr:response regulator transcription factor [Anaerolineae bacterium]
MAKYILVVDDDDLMRRSVAFSLEKNGYRTATAATAEDALALAQQDMPDLILLDIGLPGMDGLDALRRLQRQADVPVIFVTARQRELDEVLGLELGAEDYITKPFEMSVLLARVKTVLRRFERTPAAAGPQPKPLEVGDLVIDPAAHTVTLNGAPVELRPREFDILYVLALEAGHVLTVDELLNRVWGAEYSGESQNVYVHIRWLREKIEADPQKPRRIITVRGVGYRLEPQGLS